MRQSHLYNSVKWNAANANSRVSRLKALLAGSAWCPTPAEERGRNGQDRVWCNSSDKTSPEHGVQSHLTHSDCLTPTILSTLAAFQGETRCNRPAAEQTGWFIPKAGASESLPSSRNRRTKPRRTRLRSNGSTVNGRFDIIWRTQHTHTKAPFVILLPRSVSCGKPGRGVERENIHVSFNKPPKPLVGTCIV